MANVKISELAAVSTIAGTEPIPLVQGGANSSVTPALLATYVRGTITGGTGTVTSVSIATGTTGLTTSGGPITTSGTITIGGTLAVANGGTGVTTSTGSGGNVLSNSPTLVTPTLTGIVATNTINAAGQLHATVSDSGIGLLVNGGSKGFRVVPNATETRIEGVDNTGVGSFQPLIISGSFVGISTSLQYGGVTLSSAVTGTGAMVLSNSPTLVTPNLGTPSAAVLTSATGLPVTTGISGMAAAMTTFLATPSSANFAAVVTNETGTGSVVFNTNPILITPDIGTPSAGVMTNVTGLPLTTGVTGVLTVGKGGTNTTTASTGSGGIVLANSPSLVTPNLGTPSAAVLTNATGLPATTGITGILTTANGGTNTSSASTGTGGVVLATNAALVTPTLGVASGTSMTADAFMVTTNFCVSTATNAKTLVSADNGKHFKFTTTAAVTLSVNTGLPVGFWAAASQGAAGQITIAGTATTTSANGKKSNGLGSKVMVEYWATTDTYLISGNITT